MAVGWRADRAVPPRTNRTRISLGNMLHLEMIGVGLTILWHQKPARASSREGIKGISQRASVQGKRGTMARGA